jgi:ABC-type Fe3+ transport system permease subunit
VAIAAVMTVLAAMPAGSLIYRAGMQVAKVEGLAARQWSAGQVVTRILGDHWSRVETVASPEPGVMARFREELWLSLQLGVMAAWAAMLLGLLLAWWIRRPRRTALPVIFLLAAALALPGPLVALGLIFLLNRPELPWLVALYDQTLLAPWLALLVRTLPWATLVLWFALRTVPADVLDAATVEGAGPLAKLIRIVLPLRWSALVLAWLVAFVLALGDMAFTVIVLPPGVETISVRIFRLMHAAADSEVAAVCLLILLGASAATAVFAVLARTELRRAATQGRSTPVEG